MGEPRFLDLDRTDACRTLKTCTPPDLARVLGVERIDSYDIEVAHGLRFNYASKQVDEKILEVLEDLANEQELVSQYIALANGSVMNTGENRRVLHHLLRGRVDIPVIDSGFDYESFFSEQRDRFSEFAVKLRSEVIRGSTGKPIREIVQIGIGGSDLGPRALYLALQNTVPEERRISASFVSNVDPDDAFATLDRIDPESTMFVIVTKSGTTQETLTNRRLILEAARRSGDPNFDPAKHMVVVTSRTSPLSSSGEYLDSFYIDDAIGGRYSATSAVGGVVLACALGPKVFDGILSGAHEADVAAAQRGIRKNAALLDALIGVYERSVLGYPSTAILPYSQGLSRFPAHLQQLDMESNGKRVNRNGEPVKYSTGPIVFGEPGTNGQHSFYQLLHQGTDIVPLQFIGFLRSQLGRDYIHNKSTSHQKLNANLAAQIIAFAKGSDDPNPNKRFPGNRPSSLLYAPQLTAQTIGALLAHYENKIMFQGFAWNLNSFDQEGVQLGKLLTNRVLDLVIDDASIEGSSTAKTQDRAEEETAILTRFAELLGIGS